MKILVMQGIGDSYWGLLKVRGIADQYAADRIDLRIACWSRNEIETRSLEFLRRFDFVDSVEMHEMPRDGRRGPCHPSDAWTDEKGRHIYIPSGPTSEYPGIDYVAIPNGHLERGQRIEEWLPEIPTDWEVIEHFRFEPNELRFAEEMRKKGPYAVVFFGSLRSNTDVGHNRGPLWTATDWLQVINGLARRGFRVVAVGARYDLDFYEHRLAPLKPLLAENFIGQHDIGQTMAILRNANVCISFQSGIGIMATYFDCPTCMWWRPDGDSILPNALVSFDERMATAWVPPHMLEQGLYKPMIYGRETPDDVLAFCEKWL